MPTAASDPLRDRAARPPALVLAGLITLSIAGAYVAAGFRSGWGTVAALAASAAADVALAVVSPPVAGLLRRLGAGPPVRTALRMTAVVLLAGQSLSRHVFVGSAATTVAVVGAVTAAAGSRQALARLRRLPLLTRGIDLPADASPAPVPAWLMTDRGLDAVAPLLAALGVAAAMHVGSPAAAAAAGLAAATIAAVLPVIPVGGRLARLSRTRGRLTTAATAAVERLAPQVLLYFDAAAEETYQVRMWLEPLRRLDRPAALVVRRHEVFDTLGDVGLPVICTPYNGILASLRLPPRVVGLFVTHSGNNLALIRRREVRTVFVGHGDSDKPDSVNPFARVYDEIWVAGPLGRRRYLDADIGVRPNAIVTVGRPQLVPAPPPTTTPPTVVYAPTWEGWGDDPHHSSLAHAGVPLVESLLARGDVTVRYRPHPLTGNRDPRLRAAHRRIVDLVGAVPAEEPVAATLAASAGLIADVSSLVSDYFALDRPYAIVDTRGLGREQFVARFPSSAGGIVLGPDLSGLDDFVNAVHGGADASRTARRELLADVLGDPATAQARFAAAVDRLLG